MENRNQDWGDSAGWLRGARTIGAAGLGGAIHAVLFLLLAVQGASCYVRTEENILKYEVIPELQQERNFENAALPYSLERKVDAFEDVTTVTMQGNDLGGRDLAEPRFELNCLGVLYPDGSRRYTLWTFYYAEDWLFVRKGESLVLLVDGERIGFSENAAGIKREILHQRRLGETVFYDVDLKTIEKIGQAHTVRAKLKGAKYFLEREFTPENRAHFLDFVRRASPTE